MDVGLRLGTARLTLDSISGEYADELAAIGRSLTEDADILMSRLPWPGRLNLPGMTHVMKTAADDSRAANLATYSDPTLPLAQGLVPGIAGFIKARQ